MITIIYTIVFLLYIVIRVGLSNSIARVLLNSLDKEPMPSDKYGKRYLIYDFLNEHGFRVDQVYLSDMNRTAFVVMIKGRAVVVIDRATYFKYDRNSIVSIIAHEFGHFKLSHFRKDIIFMSSLLLLSAPCMYIIEQYMWPLSFIIPVISYFIYLYHSRSQEYAADRWAAVNHSAIQRCSILTRIREDKKFPEWLRRHPNVVKRYKKLLPLILDERKRSKKHKGN